ncbi:MAG TPA: hypothetical protein VKE25_01270 [Actinomycetes bacterium]|nr:hypothetical protein [Actinomycetes bacterium]
MDLPTDKVQFGQESDGDPLFMSRRMVAAWTQICRDFGQELVIIQGAFKDGKGAKASAGYHDKSGALDIRMRTLTPNEREDFIRVARAIGWAAWVRDEEHGGFDLHAHLALLDEPNVDGQLKGQMDEYVAGGSGGNGLTGNSRGPDYHPRPQPIPRFDYEAWLDQENDVQLNDRVKLSDGTADALGFKRGTEVSVGGLLQTTARNAALARRDAAKARALANLAAEQSGATLDKIHEVQEAIDAEPENEPE